MPYNNMNNHSNLYTPLLEPYPRGQAVGDVWGGVFGTASASCTHLQKSLVLLAWHSSLPSGMWPGMNVPRPSIRLKWASPSLSLAFLLVLLKAPYELFGSHAIWAIMTLIVVFEFSIGAALSKGLNRGAGTLLAGLLAVIIGQLAKMSGDVAHPIMVGLSVFVIGGIVTFAKLWPTLKSYEFGFRTFLLTFSLILVAEYRQGNPVNTAVNRFLIILVGAAIDFCVNLFVLPLWAGEELHEAVSKNFAGVADSLEGCEARCCRVTAIVTDVKWNGRNEEWLREWMWEPTLPTLL